MIIQLCTSITKFFWIWKSSNHSCSQLSYWEKCKTSWIFLVYIFSSSIGLIKKALTTSSSWNGTWKNVAWYFPAKKHVTWYFIRWKCVAWTITGGYLRKTNVTWFMLHKTKSWRRASYYSFTEKMLRGTSVTFNQHNNLFNNRKPRWRKQLTMTCNNDFPYLFRCKSKAVLS